MKTYRPATRTAAVPLKSLLAKGSVVFFVFMSLVLIVLSERDTGSVTRLRMAIVDGLVPVMEVLSSPARFAERTQRWVGDVALLYSENARLREENARLKQWEKIAGQLDVENAALRRLVNLKENTALSFVAARVVGGAGHVYTQRLLIDSGAREGVKSAQAVISDKGLVGRVMEVGAHSAHVLTITDINSRIPVIGETTREKAILAGDNTGAPVLMYLPDESRLQVGERILTTDDGAIFPAGLSVGEVSAVEGALVRVRPYAGFHQLEYIEVVSPNRL